MEAMFARQYVSAKSTIKFSISSLLIPAVLITLSFAFTRQRRNMLLSCLGGRPGLAFPMDSLTPSRISYACAFGATAFLAYDIVMEGRLIIDTPVDKTARSFAAILSVLVYGMVFFPVFACLALSSVFGFVLGALYVWMLLSVQIFKLTECQTTPQGRILLVLQSLPILLCLIYLSVSIPVRIVICFRKGQYFIGNTTSLTQENIKESYAGHHVTKLFRKPRVKKPVEGRKAAMQAAAKRLVYQFVYHRKKGFRYPARILSVMLLGVMVVYILAFQIVALTSSRSWWNCKKSSQASSVRRRMMMMKRATQNGHYSAAIVSSGSVVAMVFCVVAMFVAIALATFFSILNVLHALTSYRNNLLALYKGDHSNIPPAEAGGNVSYCVNSIKYGGFQVGYIVWGFIIQFAVLTLICFLLAIVVLLLEGGYYQWILDLLLIFWPVILVTVIIMVTQNLLARFVFLQGRGIYLALDNRFCFFIFTYFMFFYNIFLGLISCLLRIVKAIVLGIIFLGRLDNSTLSRKFEFFDPGFSAYRGFMHMECAHTHPVVIVFARLVIQTWEASKQGRVPQSVHSTEGEMDVKVSLLDIDTQSEDAPAPQHEGSLQLASDVHAAAQPGAARHAQGLHAAVTSGARAGRTHPHLRQPGQHQRRQSGRADPAG
ncbi:LOW QUALITY PROTEIN: receptor for retinol uptake stra6-like [Pomacea canaliculata]|uniref:LOW QUALITY PROTEIN: receptor for retinol uptake stra6-like n=1 Tax=Pomacea canaliculata TaxID=400727 RepID=UPI000D72E8C1|nr:LOW QUALITY PROTEIN: receptor for retinol uptake stra6-like [Pomacea canaliculata]